MSERLWIGRDRRTGEYYVGYADATERRHLRATPDQIHSALAQNGWVRYQLPVDNEQEPVRGYYVHSNNFPLDQSAEPLRPFYAE